jgi:hypothetical protein
MSTDPIRFTNGLAVPTDSREAVQVAKARLMDLPVDELKELCVRTTGDASSVKDQLLHDHLTFGVLLIRSELRRRRIDPSTVIGG